MVTTTIIGTCHLTYFNKNKSMRSEPQNIGLAFNVLTPKLSCLIRFDQLIFQTNVFKRASSGKISLVVTCPADCTYHHLKIPAKIQISVRTDQFETNISI